MKKAIFKALSIALVLVMCLSVSMIASAESAWYYKDIDFSESQYANGANLSNQVSGGTTIENGAVKITAIKGNKNNARNQSACIRLVDETGANNGQLWLTPGKDYRVSFDIKVVSSTSSLINVGYKRLNNGNMPVGTTGLTFVSDLSWNTSDVAGQGYIRRSFEFSTTDITDTNRRLLLFVFTNNSGNTDYTCEIYIDNIVIEEKVAITYSGDADATGLPTTAWAAQTYADVLGEAAGNWYTDAECNTVASGVINNNAVTLYGKAPAADPSFGVEVSTKAGLFIGGKDASTNAGIAGISDNSAVYVGDDGTEYTAFRVYGTYVAPDKGDGTPDFGKVVLDAEGNTADLVSRHVMLGYNVANAEDLTIENNFAKSETATFDKCWKYEENDDGSFTVTYSLLLKDIPKDYVSTTFSVRSAVVTDDGAIYSADMLTGISALATYNGVKDTVDYTIGWFAE